MTLTHSKVYEIVCDRCGIRQHIETGGEEPDIIWPPAWIEYRRDFHEGLGHLCPPCSSGFDAWLWEEKTKAGISQ